MPCSSPTGHQPRLCPLLGLLLLGLLPVLQGGQCVVVVPGVAPFCDDLRERLGSGAVAAGGSTHSRLVLIPSRPHGKHLDEATSDFRAALVALVDSGVLDQSAVAVLLDIPLEIVESHLRAARRPD